MFFCCWAEAATAREAIENLTHRCPFDRAASTEQHACDAVFCERAVRGWTDPESRVLSAAFRDRLRTTFLFQRLVCCAIRAGRYGLVRRIVADLVTRRRDRDNITDLETVDVLTVVEGALCDLVTRGVLTEEHRFSHILDFLVTSALQLCPIRNAATAIADTATAEVVPDDADDWQEEGRSQERKERKERKECEGSVQGQRNAADLLRILPVMACMFGNTLALACLLSRTDLCCHSDAASLIDTVLPTIVEGTRGWHQMSAPDDPAVDHADPSKHSSEKKRELLETLMNFVISY